MSDASHLEGNPVTAAALPSAGDAPAGGGHRRYRRSVRAALANGVGRPLRNISEVRHFFRTNGVPITFPLGASLN